MRDYAHLLLTLPAIITLVVVAALSVQPLPTEPSPLPRALILGDSISIGYTPHVRCALAGQATVTRPGENCQGTDYWLAHLDEWLGDGQWDVIHANVGLHDMLAMDPQTGQPSDDPAAPRQTPVDEYEWQLDIIADRLDATGATIIWATITPVPHGVSPYRDPEDVGRYNAVAVAIARERGWVVNDLHAVAMAQPDQIQLPRDTHFNDAGYRVLGRAVAAAIRSVIDEGHQ